MPAMIAMIVVIIAAIAYMFNSYGTSGDKIQTIAKKANVESEINNIRDAIRNYDLVSDITTASNLDAMSQKKVFDSTMSAAMTGTTTAMIYNSVSFGPKLKLSIIKPTAVGIQQSISVDFSTLISTADDREFLEQQIATDFQSVAVVNTLGQAGATPDVLGAAGTASDGKLTITFKDAPKAI